MSEIGANQVQEVKNKVLQAQEERAVAYNYFETGFRQLVDDQEEEAYRKICEGVTPQFQDASESINSQLGSLQTVQHPAAQSLTSLIRQLQGAEKQKLHLTIAMHVERKRAAQYRKSLEDEAEHSKQHGLKPECSCTKAAKEVLPDEFEVAEQEKKVKAMQQAMDELVTTINECLDEIRYLEIAEC